MHHDNDNQPGDILFGAKAIAEYLGLSTKQIYRLIYSESLPVFKLGGTLSARRSTLERHFAALESA